MSHENPFDLLFGGMAKLGPGADEHTLRVLRSLPERTFEVVVERELGLR